MSTRTIPAQVIQSCDCCGDVLSADAKNHREEGHLTIKATALDMQGAGIGNAGFQMDMCDPCLSLILNAIESARFSRQVIVPTALPEQATVTKAPQMLNTNDKAMWVVGWNECLSIVKRAATVRRKA